MYFTENIKEELVTWMEPLRESIRGMDDLYKQIARDDEVNPSADDGLFFQAQVTRQIVESGKFDTIEVEAKGYANGIKYDIDIMLDNHIYVQVWLGENAFAYELGKTIRSNSTKPRLHPVITNWNHDRSVRQKKLGQLDKPRTVLPTSTHSSDIVKILVAAPRTRFSLLWLPEWDQQLADRVMMELRGSFDSRNNLSGLAALHRLHRQHDKVAKVIVDVLGFRYVESLDDASASRPSRQFGNLPINPWQYSYLHTASQSIRLWPKVMGSPFGTSVVTGMLTDLTRCKLSPAFVRGIVDDLLQDEVCRAIWTDVELLDQSTDDNAPYRLESFDGVISSQKESNSLHHWSCNVYHEAMNRDKTAAYDATVIDARGSTLELDHVYKLLDGIMAKTRSKKRPDCFVGDCMALWRLLEIGRETGRYREVRVPYNNTSIVLPSFEGIPVWLSFMYCKPGCIYAIRWKDELGIRTGLRLLASSHSAIEAGLCNSDGSYVIGETVVDPKACGKIVHLRERNKIQ